MPAMTSGGSGMMVMRQRFDHDRFEWLVHTAEHYPLSIRTGEISIAALREANLIPANMLIGPPEPYSFLRYTAEGVDRTDPTYAAGVWLYTDGDKIVIGERAWYPAVAGIIARCRGIGAEAHFIAFPGVKPSALDEALGALMVEFTPVQLAKIEETGAKSADRP